MAKGDNSDQKGGIKFTLPERTINAYSLTESEVNGLGSLGSVANVFMNLTTVFLGSGLGSISGVVAQPSNSINWLILTGSFLLTVLFGALTAYVNRKSDDIKKLIKNNGQ